ncbi:MAG: patatin-like phospholipase family protein [Gemmataceae bacterium]|nr:patatin-like phospholipase family protein [Gemmataceae bacterium]
MRARHLLVVAAAAVLLAVPACLPRKCVPTELSTKRNLVDLSAGPDDHAPASPGLIRDVDDTVRARTAALQPAGARPYHFLALSGGGLYGAFGAGIGAGWTDTGTRPQFDVVTGISVGSLIAVFLFLGPQYDDLLHDEVVGVSRSDLLRLRLIATVPFAGALFNTGPIERRIERAYTPQVLAEVAAAHAAGRRLYVGTTNLDTRRLVIWDMGAIASQGTRESMELFHKVLLASSSIPGAFPPVRLPVEVDGRRYEELHVDGGASDEVFFRAFMVADLNRMNGLPGGVAPAGSTLYLVNNGKMYAEPSCVRPRVGPLLGATYRSVIYGKTRDELYRIYLNCLATGVNFRHTAIPQEYDMGGGGALGLSDEDQQRLFDLGRGIGRFAGEGGPWRELPPGTDTTEQVLPRSGTRFATPDRAGGAGAPCYQR